LVGHLGAHIDSVGFVTVGLAAIAFDHCECKVAGVGTCALLVGHLGAHIDSVGFVTVGLVAAIAFDNCECKVVGVGILRIVGRASWGPH
jgi:hypothetical protein